MNELIILSLATFLLWEFALELLPFKVPHWLAPIFVVGVAYLITLLPANPILLPIAAAGAVALLHNWLSPSDTRPEPRTLPRLPKRRQSPTVADAKVGKRINKI